jgi:hypothetical protein
LLACSWSVEGTRVALAVDVPAGTTAELVLPGADESRQLGSGHVKLSYDVAPAVAQRWSQT